MKIRLRYAITTVALVTLALGAAWLQQGPDHRPTSAHPPASARPPAPPPPPPTARGLLDRADVLGLDSAQRASLRALATGWAAESARLQREVDAASEEFSRWMNETRAAGRTPLAEIQRRSTEVAAAGAELRRRRRLHAEAAAGLLTNAQRSRLGAIAPMTVHGGNT